MHDSDNTSHDAVFQLQWEKIAKLRLEFRRRVITELAKLRKTNRLRRPIRSVMREIESGLTLAWIKRNTDANSLAGQHHWEKTVRRNDKRRKISDETLRSATRVFVDTKLRRQKVDADTALERASRAEINDPDLSKKDRQSIERLAKDLNAPSSAKRGRRKSEINVQWIGNMCGVVELATGSKIGFSRRPDPDGPWFRILRSAVDYYLAEKDEKEQLMDETIAKYMRRRHSQ